MGLMITGKTPPIVSILFLLCEISGEGEQWRERVGGGEGDEFDNVIGQRIVSFWSFDKLH